MVRSVTDDHLRMLRQDFWDQRYAARSRLWSGRPNGHVVERILDLPPGRALDVGSGEGADAIWLAEQGWDVTAIDVSRVALERAAGHAEAAGPDVAARIAWRHEDVLRWGPDPGAFDLVSSQFMHLPPGPREALFARLAAGVAPRGTLLIVGHHPSDLGVVPRGHGEMLFTAEDVAARLDPGTWDVVLADAPGRVATNPAGEDVTIHDARLQARRRA
jgi:2-polyprenyl-3-methyl-5-hydroxy-6-metoxy-1,4-benzoquinol methylase